MDRNQADQGMVDRINAGKERLAPSGLRDDNRWDTLQQQTTQGATPGGTCGEPFTPLRDEYGKRYHYHAEQARKAEQAAGFFRDNPAFDDFVRLVRSGVISF